MPGCSPQIVYRSDDMEWISVEDKLPDDLHNNVVLGWVRLIGGWAARSGIMNSDKTFWRSLEQEALTCTHWMPLPDAPKNNSKTTKE